MMVNILKNGYYKTNVKITILGINMRMGLPMASQKGGDTPCSIVQNRELCNNAEGSLGIWVGQPSPTGMVVELEEGVTRYLGLVTNWVNGLN